MSQARVQIGFCGGRLWLTAFIQRDKKHELPWSHTIKNFSANICVSPLDAAACGDCGTELIV